MSAHKQFNRTLAQAFLHLSSNVLNRLEDAVDHIAHPDEVTLHGHTADEKVKDAKHLAEQHISAVLQAYRILQHSSTEAATLEACFDAWKDGWTKLSPDWVEHSEVTKAEVHKTEAQLLAMLNWIVSRPTAAEPNSDQDDTMSLKNFDAAFLRKKRDNDSKALIQGYGNFSVDHSERDFEDAVKRLQDIDYKLAKAAVSLSATEARYSHFKGRKVTQQARKGLAQSEALEEEANKALETDGAMVEHDLKQLASSEAQFRALEFCIDSVARDIDESTNRAHAAMAVVAKLQSEVSALRPWKDQGASQTTYDGFMCVRVEARSEYRSQV